ncbi:nuclear transport factor 2 family protein [Dactylosporangium sp. NPDC048998]|uniref:nuclear transport factor 2 family protein n=1 Tax=Dactylosporangium sp. NPDC048998 TaxID=3363976 RepID=UPI0037213971
MVTGLSPAEALWEIEAIKQVKARYCRLVDLRDWDGVVGLFSLGCEFVHPVHTDVTGPRDFFERVARRITPGVSVHQVHAPEITLTSATTAAGTWALHDYVETDDGTIRYQGYGFYHDELAKNEDGCWVITSFRQHRLRMDSVPPVTPWDPKEGTPREHHR